MLHRNQGGEKVEGTSSNLVSMSTAVANQVLLSTAMVKIVNPETKQCLEARCLLDCGSQSSFITKSLKDRLGIQGQAVRSLTVAGINNISIDALENCKFELVSCISSFTKQVYALVIPSITGNLPSTEVDASEINIPQNIKLADTRFNYPATVDVLIGADLFWDIINPEKLAMGHNQPSLQNSQLGWLVVGPVMCPTNKVYCNFSQDVSTTLKKFWELEELPADKKYTDEEEQCEAHFRENTYRTEEGRFCVKLPFKIHPEQLGDSYKMSRSRFDNLERRFERQPHIKKQYVDFIDEYHDLGHLSVVDKPETFNFLPHHAVIRENAEKTKCRVVFDASAKTDSGLSLNDILMVGPKVQDDIMSILLRFRQHKLVFTGDVAKFYRQILVDQSQRYLQMILWRPNRGEQIKFLQLNTVTYGTSSAPFLSTRCLLQLALECQDPKIREVIEHDFYCDDILTGSDSVEELRYIQESVENVLASACLKLPKIRTNCESLFKEKEGYDSQEKVQINTECIILGMKWNPCSDNLLISYNPDDNIREGKLTKRTILSDSSKIFDPLGLLCVCTVMFKMLLQQLWLQELKWDDEIPTDMQTAWQRLTKGLKILSLLEIPRHIICNEPVRIEIHAFSDASLKAYAGCIYIRSVNKEGEIFVRLLCAKTRVAPLKAVTIPKLELCGAVLAAKLCSTVVKALRCAIVKIVYWSDSQIVLSWLKGQQSRLKTFVLHRVEIIKNITSSQGDSSWMYVPSAQNPADLASRGLFPEQLENNNLWWEGPTFLKCEDSQWPDQSMLKCSELPELKVFVVNDVDNEFVVNIKRFSTLRKLKRAYAFVLRFIKNFRNSNKLIGPLTVEELDEAERQLIKFCQRECFELEVNSLKINRKVHEKSALISLSPFLDDQGIMLVGGRLENSDYSHFKKHPIILSAKHHFTKLLFEHEHKRLLHAGPQLLLASIRERYWPVAGRTLARKVFRQCITCKRMQGRVAAQIMGNLPLQRMIPGFPFEVVGIDYAGPILISTRKGRGARLVKAYLCVVVCFKTKACHLELVSDLTTEAFILALRRFISRRGKPKEIFCDNGSNFVGASRELQRSIDSDLVLDFSANEGIKFHFSPAYAPNFGGLHEAGVKIAKSLMKKVVGNSHLTFEELTTLFAQIEAVMNSRPLTPLSSNPFDLSPLTPGHFLIGRPLTSLPAPDLQGANPNRLHRYARIEQARQHFWSRWSHEYIAELHQRTKWRTRHEDLRPGQLVLIKDEQTPPLKWPLGRIHRLYPGSDQTSRVADVQTTRGIVKRSIRKIVPLLDDAEGEQP